MWDTKPAPEVGEKKYKVRFALLPKKTNDKKTVWFERYIAEYIFYSTLSWQEGSKWVSTLCG